MRYLPLTEADRHEMLAKIGARSVDELFRDVPTSARLGAKIAGLPDHLGELEVESSRSSAPSRPMRRRTSRRAARRSSSAPAPIAIMCLRPSTT
jgi:glycine cleavage system pyridoxal-binding protein P